MGKINLFDLGLSEQHVREAALYGAGFHLARISAQHREIYSVITENGEIRAVVSGKLNYAATVTADYPVVGDWVLVDRVDDISGSAVIHAILSRKSCFERKAAGTGHERQVIAANIDTVFICMSLNKDYNLRRVERYLAIAWDSGAVPVIVLTKADLCWDTEAKLTELQAVACGVDVVVTSSMSTDGYAGISRYLQKGQTIAFIGSSGVGKSTLINKLMGEEVLATKEIREDDSHGRHATTHRQLLVLPGGGVVIDTPGMREIQIAGADLSKSFADIEEYAEDCYFRDCRHDSEPRCAVRKAIEDGLLSIKRFENYKKLQNEMEYLERKGSMTAAQSEKQKIIGMMGSLDAHKQVLKNKPKYKR